MGLCSVALLLVILSGAKDLLQYTYRIPALGRGRARYFCRHKSTQKGFQQKCFFAHKAFAPQINQNHGLQLFALLRSLNSASSAKLAMPLQPHSPPSFCPLSPEAYLLTGKKFLFLTLFPPKAKRGSTSAAQSG